ncbi:LysR family transcriptional regulator [Priestia megaterium]|nr:LysR family transcriptional regulator [Priestia megaterium]
MTIARFEVFSKVVELGSFTKAAEDLHMTQSAVSHAIASLESEWGVNLLIRAKGKDLALTEVGTKILIQVREILNRMEHINQEIALQANLEIGTIRIGSFTSASACLLPKIISKFHRKYPKIELKLFEGSYEEIIEWLKMGVIDIGFIIEHNLDCEFDTVPLIEDTIAVAFPENRKFLGKDFIQIEDLKNEPLIMPKGMYQLYIEEIFQKAKVQPNVRFEVQDCNTIANMVNEGLGVTVGSELFLKTQPNIHTKRLQLASLRKVALACMSKQDTTPAVQSFLKVATEVYSQT